MRETENLYTRCPSSLASFPREVLRRELEERKARNPRYSLRGFAHHLGMDPSAVSRILAGKQDLSLRAAEKIVSILELSDADKDRLLLAVAELAKERATQFLSRSCNKDLRQSHADAVNRESSIVGSVKLRIDANRISEATELLQTFAHTLERLFGSDSLQPSYELNLNHKVNLAEPVAADSLDAPRERNLM